MDLCGGVTPDVGDAEQNVLGGDVLVLQALRFVERALQDLIGRLAQELVGDS
jgi:hypothetical protein